MGKISSAEAAPPTHKLEPLPVVADIPTDQPGLGFGEYADALASAVLGGEPPQFTIGLYGAWGSGKSSLLSAIRSRLDRSDAVIPVLFDAWRYERSDHIVLPLLHAILTEVQKQNEPAIADHLRRVLGALAAGLNLKLGPVTIDPGAAKDKWEERAVQNLDDAFGKPFAELARLPDSLDGKRIAILIDDLDRCSPENIVSVLETINVVMDVHGFIYVLAVDYEMLVRAIETRYPHASGHRFIEKMVQIPFRVPPLSLEGPGVLAHLLPADASSGLPPRLDETIISVASLGLRSNPRQVKRLVNSLLLALHIGRERGLRLDARLLTTLLGIQLGWPGAYQAFQDQVFSDSAQPFSVLFESSDEYLVRYADAFWKREELPPADTLKPILRLTSVIVGDQKSSRKSGPLGATALEFVSALEANGFVLGTETREGAHVYVKPGAHYRFSVTNGAVEFHRAGRRGSQTKVEEYRLPERLEDALEKIVKPYVSTR